LGFDTTPVTSNATNSVCIGTYAGRYLEYSANDNACVFIGKNAGRGNYDVSSIMNTGYWNVGIGYSSLRK